MADLLDGIPTVFVIIEPDRGGDVVQKWIATSKLRDRIQLLTCGEFKDPSQLYLANPAGFRDAWRAVIERGVSWREQQQRVQQQAAAEAYALSRDLLHAPDLLDRIGQAIKTAGYAGDVNPAVLTYLAITSRLLPRPLNVALVAASASGKNCTVDAAVDLVPPEAVHIEKAGSARALIYTSSSSSTGP
jgi:hypothetical protein